MIDLQPGETIVLKVRKHWFVLARQVALMLVLLVAPFAIWFANGYLHAITVPGDQGHLALALGALWALVVWLLFFVFWTNYYLDLWVVTDKHVMNLEQKSFFHREVGMIRLDRIQDITVEINGLLRTLLKFGRIRVQSAGEEEEFIMDDIADPDAIKLKIAELSDKAVDRFARDPATQ